LRGAFNPELSEFLGDFPTPAYAENKDGIVVFANSAYVNMLNSNHEKILGSQSGVNSPFFHVVRSMAGDMENLGTTLDSEVLLRVIPTGAKECMALGTPSATKDKDGNDLILWSLHDISLFVSYEQELEDKHRELRSQQSKLKELAAIDPLTGASNRRSFYDQAEEVVTYAEIGGLDIGVLMFDLDNFKALNDTYGHAAGDQVLIEFTKLAEDCIRSSDIFARLGGEEFALLLPDAPAEATQRIANRIIKRTSETEIKFEDQSIFFTTSAGGAMWHAEDKKIDISLGRADKQLYHAKNSGRNQLQFQHLILDQENVA